MALKGIFYGTTDTTVKCRIQWSAVQSVAGNYSDVTATLSYIKLNSNKTYGTWRGSITINGTQTAGSKYLSITSAGYVEAMTATVRVYHDSYGKAAFTISGAGAISGTSLSSTSVSQKVEPDTIARASEISMTDANIESAATVVISRKNDSYTHSVAYAFGGLQGYLDNSGALVEEEVKLTETTLNVTLPESFYAQIPDAPSGEGMLTCSTYSGDTLVGTHTCRFIATAAQSRCAPLLEASVEDVNPVSLSLTGDKNKLIRFVSTARCRVAAIAQKEAAIVHRQVQGENMTDVLLDIPETELGSYTVTATDSRGYTTRQEICCPIIPYVVLTANVTLVRTDPTSGNGRLTVRGCCYNGSFGAVENTLSVSCRIGDQEIALDPQWQTDHTYYVEAPISGLDYNKTYHAVLTVMDAVGTVTKDVTVNPGIPVFDWGQKDFSFHVPVTAPLFNGLDTDKLFRDRGDCQDADTAVLAGVYGLTEATANAPNQNGILLVLENGERVLQLAVDFGGQQRKLRTIWYGEVWPWQVW